MTREEIAKEFQKLLRECEAQNIKIYYANNLEDPARLWAWKSDNIQFKDQNVICFNYVW